MKYVYAALFLDAAGIEVNERTLTSTLESAGGDVDPVRVQELNSKLENTDIQEFIGGGVVQYAYATLLLDKIHPKITSQALRETLDSADIGINPARIEALNSVLNDFNLEKASQEALATGDKPSNSETRLKRSGSNSMALIVHLETGQTLRIKDGDTVGRAGSDGPPATITVEDPHDEYIAAVQFQFTEENGKWYLIDRSLNGTFINNGSEWQRVLCESGKERLREQGEDYTDRNGETPPESLRLRNGDVIALVDPSYGITLEFHSE